MHKFCVRWIPGKKYIAVKVSLVYLKLKRLSVFGGLNGFYDETILLDSIEIYSPENGDGWRSGANLPQPMYGLRATNIDSRVLLFGKITILKTS